VRASPQQDIHIHLPRRNEQAVAIAGRYDGMTVCEAYAQRAMRDYFREGEVGRFNVKVAFDNVQVWCYTAEEFVRFFIGYVAQTEDLANLPRGEQLLELFVVLLAGAAV
jgi:hypothetical protein